jgi:hypothetical protein
LIAEEVAEVYPHLVGYDRDGEIRTVQYDLINALLLNEAQPLELEAGPGLVPEEPGPVGALEAGGRLQYL